MMHVYFFRRFANLTVAIIGRGRIFDEIHWTCSDRRPSKQRDHRLSIPLRDAQILRLRRRLWPITHESG